MEPRNPFPTVDVIVQRENKVLMVRRGKDPFQGQLALPGGFINRGETAESAAAREVHEETGLEVEPIEILGVYSDPKRDPRGHMMSTVFVAIILGGNAKAGDDAAELEWVSIDDLRDPSLARKHKFAFDHGLILRDYFQWKEAGGTYWSSKRRSI
ncbi:MAG TPA: NUDIX hydrolase [Nitrososphaera sp.]|nr:NUDIX hydrolase [Nitrososphaera sp.]